MLTKIYSNTYALNGTNSTVYAFFSNDNNLIQLDSLSSLSFKTKAQVSPVFALGTPNVVGYTYGAKTVYGAMGFIASDKSPLMDVSRHIVGRIPAVYDKVTEYEMDTQNDGDMTFHIEPETLPPFGLLVISEPEMPRIQYSSGVAVPTISYYVISGVKIMSTSNNFDAMNAQTPQTLEYMAQNITRHHMVPNGSVDAQEILAQAVSTVKIEDGDMNLSDAVYAYLKAGANK